MINKKRFRFRMIIPAFANYNIYSFAAKTTTSIGPVCVATTANKLENWDVEVIDENNCQNRYCPKDKKGLPDHEKLQKERPADVVGFYGSISSTIPRVYKLAEFYKGIGVTTVSGGKHVENLPDEGLSNYLDIIVNGDGEKAIRDILLALENNTPINKIPGIFYLNKNKVTGTVKRPLLEDFDTLPYPDFNLLLYAKMKYYPISRIRGCNSRCEFCAVKDKTRCASPEWMMGQIKHLVETMGATHLFEASDHFAANQEESIRFCKMLSEYQKKIGKRLSITVQIRITDARNEELLKAMKEANVDMVCIGYESPVDEELLSMKKGYLSKDLLEWTRRYHKYGFFIHGMFMMGYPKKDKNKDEISFEERIQRFKQFIKKARLDTLQVLLTIPLPGTELRNRLEKENRLYPLDQIGWEYYDGQFPLFKPDNDVTPEMLQNGVKKIMCKFYNFINFWKLLKNIIFHFPRIVFFSVFTLLTFRIRYIVKAFRSWKKKYYRNQILRFGGTFVIKGWMKHFKKDNFMEKLNEAKQILKKRRQSMNYY